MEFTLDTIRDIEIYQSKKGYRFSVDALLLYSFVNLPAAKRIADFGAGSGIIGILLAKKYPGARVVLLELQESLLRLAEMNVRHNRLEERVAVIGCDVGTLAEKGRAGKILAEGPYDVVVANPPFRRPKTGLISPEEERAIARHEIRLKIHELVHAAGILLRPRGRLFLVYHPERLAELTDALRPARMEMKRLRCVHSLPSSEAKMILVEAVKEGRSGLKIESPCILYDREGVYSAELRELCSGTQ
jgi:tRNA1Val (adenine37-N6)-methyltransferase